MTEKEYKGQIDKLRKYLNQRQKECQEWSNLYDDYEARAQSVEDKFILDEMDRLGL